MKSIFWMLTVFMISSSIIAQSTDEPDISPEEFLAQVNVIRREFARNLNISNMHELTWDTNLVQELIKDVEKDGEVNDNTHAYGYAKSYKKQLVDIDDEIEKTVLILKGDNQTEMDVDAYFICPLHVKIGCIYADTLPDPLVCYMSPIQYPADKLTFQEVGSPGSKCNDGYANNDGLCSLIGSFTTEAPTTTTEKQTTPEKPTAASAVADKEPQKQESGTTEGVDQASSSGTILSILQLSSVLFLNIFILF